MALLTNKILILIVKIFICLPYNIENNLNPKSPVIATESDSLSTGTTAGDRKLSLVGIVKLSGY